MKKQSWILLTLFVVMLALPFRTAAQSSDETLILGIVRTFGYGGFGGKIQGAFKLEIRSEHSDLTRVDFLIDDQVIHTADAAPFEHSFNTANYPPGLHALSAVGYHSDGSEMVSSEIARTFLSSEDAGRETRNLVLPLIVGISVLTLVGTLGSAFFARRKEFKPGQYGAAGGAVCPRCTFPYARNILSPNLLVGKLGVCPHCGKWAIVPAASSADLSAAETRLSSEGTATVDAPSESEHLDKLLDESRFER
ncbi:MAG: Ig-like domain-containing protein [Chloroflexota bacterium]